MLKQNKEFGKLLNSNVSHVLVCVGAWSLQRPLKCVGLAVLSIAFVF